jgi:predicted nuclease of predicted toxin-antitoxin system
MTPVIYLDENLDADRLIALLRRDGYRLVSPREIEAKGWSDPDVLAYCAQHDYLVLTSNPGDFNALHRQWQTEGRSHSGILIVYKENDASKDMTLVDIVRALGNLLRSGLPLANEIHCLNFWL